MMTLINPADKHEVIPVKERLWNIVKLLELQKCIVVDDE